MSEFNRLTELVAAEMLQERATTTPRHPHPRTPRRTRHALARNLHALADRLEG